MTITSTALRLLPAVPFALALFSGGPASALTEAEIAMYKGADRQKVLEAGAKKEGEATFYTTLFVDRAMKPIADAFEKKYPFLKLKYVRANSSGILQRILAEKRANAIHVDVVDGDIALQIKKAGIALPFTSPVFAEYPAEYMAKDHTWIYNRFSWQGIAWNTKLVKDSEAPKTWEALLDPKWRNKLVWASSSGTGAPRLISHLRKLWGEKKAMDYLEKLQKQKPRTLSGSIRSVLDQVVAGEYPVGVSMAMHHIAIRKAKKAPVDGISPEPQLGRAQTLLRIKGSPSPHASMLFVDFFMSKDGAQPILSKAKYNPGHPQVKPVKALAWFQPNLIGKKQLLLGPEEFESLRKKSQSLYKSMFQ